MCACCFRPREVDDDEEDLEDESPQHCESRQTEDEKERKAPTPEQGNANAIRQKLGGWPTNELGVLGTGTAVIRRASPLDDRLLSQANRPAMRPASSMESRLEIPSASEVNVLAGVEMSSLVKHAKGA